MRTVIISLILSIQVTSFYCQERPSIYELGNPIVNCETNFKNLFKNWTNQHIKNAESYDLLKYSLVETITDSNRFNYYRNYFSGIEPVGSSIRARSGGSSNGERFHEFYIEPSYIYTEVFDQRGLPAEARKLFTDEFKAKAIEILTREINIDTMNLKHYSYEKIKIDTTRGPDFKVTGTQKSFMGSKVTSPDSISKNYIDVFVTRKKSMEDFKICEKRVLILEDFLIQRIRRQTYFNELVNIGDKVYVIDFEYNNRLFSSYVICSAENNKVVLDYFFLSVQLDLEDN